MNFKIIQKGNVIDTIVIKHEGRSLVARHGDRLIAESESIYLVGIRSSVLDCAAQFDQIKVIYKRKSGPETTSDVTLFWKNKTRGLRTGMRRGWVEYLSVYAYGLAS